MKITSAMKLDRLARQTIVTASTRAGWREVRRLLVAHFNGLDTRSVKIGQWWAIQQAAWAADIRDAPATPAAA